MMMPSPPAPLRFVLFMTAGLLLPLPTVAADRDSDQDGRTDAEEKADGTNPQDPASVRPSRLGHWRFDTADWRSEEGHTPVQAGGLALETGPSQGALKVSGAILRYRSLAEEGPMFLPPHTGSLRFLYRPDWSSRDVMAPPGYAWGTGPGRPACLVEVGTADGTRVSPIFRLMLDADGTELSLVSYPASGPARTNLQSKISWTFFQPLNRKPGEAPWRELAVIWSPQSSSVIVDGSLLRDQKTKGYSGPPLPNDRGNQGRSLTVGNDSTGQAPAEGWIDELETYNYAITPLESHAHLAATALSASIAIEPPEVRLRWHLVGAVARDIRRRLPGETNWTELATQIRAVEFVDRSPELTVGRTYEYSVGDQTILVGLNAVPIEARGRVLLLVDETQAGRLESELERLRQDLRGDGWIPIQHEVPRHDDNFWARQAINPAYESALDRVRALIEEAYATAPDELKAVFLIGHVVIPYSGVSFEDGHPNHLGAWPADAYYGDLDNRWSDVVMNTASNIADPVFRNLPGDGKLDPYQFNLAMALGTTNRLNGVEIAVGRVDFANLPAFAPRTETDLLRQYLDKNHRYRLGEMPFDRAATLAGYFYGPFSGENHDIYRNAAAILSRTLGTPLPSEVHGNCFTSTASALWGMQGGYGAPETINVSPDANRALGITAHTTTNLARGIDRPRVGFFVLKGSYFADWNRWPNSFMRATLATPDYGLAAVWTRQMVWSFDGLAVGETLGAGFVQTARGGLSTRTVYLLGDPTLRAPMIPPPTEFAARRAAGEVRLTWQTPDASLRYHLYRSAPDANSPLIRLNPDPLTAGEFIDPAPTSGAQTYHVRALRLTTTGAGAYTNLSQTATITLR